MTSNEETRSHNAIANENIMLHEQLRQLRLEQAKNRTRVYQTPGDGVGVDMKLAWCMFRAGENYGYLNEDYTPDVDSVFDKAIEAYKAQQGD